MNCITSTHTAAKPRSKQSPTNHLALPAKHWSARSKRFCHVWLPTGRGQRTASRSFRSLWGLETSGEPPPSPTIKSVIISKNKLYIRIYSLTNSPPPSRLRKKLIITISEFSLPPKVGPREKNNNQQVTSVLPRWVLGFGVYYSIEKMLVRFFSDWDATCTQVSFIGPEQADYTADHEEGTHMRATTN